MLSGAASNISDAIQTLWASLPRDDQERLLNQYNHQRRTGRYPESIDYRIAIREARKSLDQAENN